MSFSINSIHSTSMSISANMSMHTQDGLQSMRRLSTGMRINDASDDASGMMIADNLRYKHKVADQAIKNINDNIGIFRIADMAMGTQVSTLIQAKEKAVALGNEAVHSKESKESLQNEIKKLIKASDTVSTNTYFNGKSLLDGYNGTIPSGLNAKTEVSIASTKSSDIGHVSVKITDEIKNATTAMLAFEVDNKEYYLQDVEIGTSANTGIGRLAEVINQKSDTLNVKATYDVKLEGSTAIKEGTIDMLKINGVTIGTLDVKDNDKDGTLSKAINAQTIQTGIEANIDIEGKLVLRSLDGRGIKVENGANGANIHNLASTETYGQLRLVSLKSDEIVLKDKNNGITNEIDNALDKVFTLQDALLIDDKETSTTDDYTSYFGTRAEITMDALESAITDINDIRTKSVASGEEQLQHCISYLETYSLNTKISESIIRDTDFAEESANFNKKNILLSASQYAFAQNNKRFQNLLSTLL